MYASTKTSDTTGTVGAGGDGAAKHDELSCRVGCPFSHLQQTISGAVLALPVVATCLHLYHVYISHEHITCGAPSPHVQSWLPTRSQVLSLL